MSIAIPPLEATCHSLNGWWSLTEDEIAENPVFTELQLDDDGVLCDFNLNNADAEYTIIDA